MDYYIHEFEKIEKEFHEVMHDYPLFKEDIDQIYDKSIKEINDLLEKNDEYYLKSAISKLKDIISYVKDTSTNIDKEYRIFDKLANEWQNIELTNISEERLNKLNDYVNKANLLIKSHDLSDIKEANKIMNSLLKESRTQ